MDRLDLNLDDSEVVLPVLETLKQHGFADVVAVQITLQMLLQYFHASPLEIIDATEAMGYSLPTEWDRLHSN